MTEEHCSDVWDIDEGDEVTLTTTTGFEVSGECISKDVHHDEGVHITEQTQWRIAGDNDQNYIFLIVRGLSGTEDSPFPSHGQLTESNTDEEMFGYISEVQ